MSERYQILVDQLMQQGMTEEDALACADREFDVVGMSSGVHIGTFAWHWAMNEKKPLQP